MSDSRESTSYTAISALFASHSDFIDLYTDLFSSHDQTAPHRSLTLKEGLLLEKLKHDRSIHPDEIIFDYRRLRSLLILQRSITLLPWILANGSKSNEALQTKDEAICIYISPDDKLLTSHSNGLSARSKIIELTITA